jgi:hypothetical protein
MAVGPNQDISLFSDFQVGDARSDLLRQLLEQPVATPVRPEVPFNVERGDSSRFRARRHWRNLVFLGDMRARGWCARLGERMLNPERLRQLKATPAGYVFGRDIWADGQTVLFVHAADADALGQLLRRDGEKMMGRFEELIIEGLAKTLFLSGEQVELEEAIRRRHGYRIRIPADFLVEEQAENRFVRMKRIVPGEPVMFFFIYYQPQATDTLNARHCMAIRDTLAAVYFGGDRIDRDHTEVHARSFLGREAIEIYGRYQNIRPPTAMGGPFKLFCFHEGGQLYLIDLAVFNPPGAKTPQMRILEAIASTFLLGPGT